VDELGGFDAAVADAAARAKLGKAGEYRVRYVEKMVTPFAQFMSGFASSNLGAALLKDSDFARTLLIKTMPETEAQLRFVQAAATDRSGAPVKTLVYCFCGL
jgi:protease-4